MGGGSGTKKSFPMSFSFTVFCDEILMKAAGGETLAQFYEINNCNLFGVIMTIIIFHFTHVVFHLFLSLLDNYLNRIHGDDDGEALFAKRIVCERYS